MIVGRDLEFSRGTIGKEGVYREYKESCATGRFPKRDAQGGGHAREKRKEAPHLSIPKAVNVDRSLLGGSCAVTRKNVRKIP